MRLVFRKLVVFILTWEARTVIRLRRPSIVAVTGSVGKTSTKDAIYSVLCEHAHVRKSEKSFNSEIGVPLTILGRPNAWDNPLRWLQNLFDGLLLVVLKTRYPDWLVLEIGADRPGDIRSIAAWLPIDIAVITRLPEVPVHVEYFDSPEQLLEEKASIISGVKPSGVLILSADDERVSGLRERAMGRTLSTFGFSPHADVRADMPSTLLDADGRIVGMHAQIKTKDDYVEMTLRGAVGAHAFLPMLAAVAAALSLDMKLADAVAALERNYVPPPGRMHLIAGMRGSVIIDDSYNASPAATEAALEALGHIKTAGRKIVVLGDMMELGRYSIDEHRRIGSHAAKMADILITVGIRVRESALAALSAGMTERTILQFEDAEGAGAELSRTLAGGDIVLIKGSQAVRLERAVKIAMAEPARASELLVRQEQEWTVR
jgi:UDP-N-acetylmuramyl pentapeptide synthase